jgi:hypothetical protein
MSDIKLNDHYFIAWLNVVKKKDYDIKNGKITVDMTSKEYGDFLEEYKNSHKPVLVKIRKVVKELNILTSNVAITK